MIHPSGAADRSLAGEAVRWRPTEALGRRPPLRGEVFGGAALTILLVAVTLVVLLGLSRIPTKASAR